MRLNEIQIQKVKTFFYEHWVLVFPIFIRFFIDSLCHIKYNIYLLSNNGLLIRLGNCWSTTNMHLIFTIMTLFLKLKSIWIKVQVTVLYFLKQLLILVFQAFLKSLSIFLGLKLMLVIIWRSSKQIISSFVLYLIENLGLKSL